MFIRVYLQPIDIEVDEQVWAEYVENDEIGITEMLLEVGEKIVEMEKAAIHHTEKIIQEKP